MGELQGWLRARGLDWKGKKDQLKARVSPLLNGPPCDVPPILPPMYGTAKDMMEVVKSMVIVVTMIFQDTVEEHTKEILELRLRIFLT